MGFRFKRFDYVGGSGSWTGGTDTTSQVARSQAVCKDFADFIIACGKGWQLDTSRNATTSDFVSVPIKNYNGTVQSFSAPGLFFTNSVSGCKLFLCVAGFSANYGINLANTYLLNECTTTDQINQNGIIFSIIPGGSSSEFGNTFDSTFLPSDATQIAGCTWCVRPSSGDTYCLNYISYNYSGHNYSYGLLVDSYCVGLMANYTTDGSTPHVYLSFVVGRVIGTLAHESDSLPQSRYGILRFSGNVGFTTSNEYEMYFGYNSTLETITRHGAYFSQTVNTTSANANDIRTKCSGALFAADGTRRDGRNSTNTRYYPHTAFALSSNSLMTNASILDAVRWVPFEIGVVSGDLDTNGVVPGDGFKGYLDTELFRCGAITYNKLYDNGTFIGVNYGTMIGWDPSNTDSL